MIFLKCDKSRSKKSFFGKENHANIATILRKYLEVTSFYSLVFGILLTHGLLYREAFFMVAKNWIRLQNGCMRMPLC